jgi:hypothetical protein
VDHLPQSIVGLLQIPGHVVQPVAQFVHVPQPIPIAREGLVFLELVHLPEHLANPLTGLLHLLTHAAELLLGLLLSHPRVGLAELQHESLMLLLHLAKAGLLLLQFLKLLLLLLQLRFLCRLLLGSRRWALSQASGCRKGEGHSSESQWGYHGAFSCV